MGGLTGAISQANGSTKKEFIWNVWASLIVVSVVSLSLIAGSITLVAMSLSVAQVIMSTTVYPLFIKPVVGVSFKEYLLSWIYTAGFCIIVIVAIDYFNLGMIIFNGITSLFG
ncbi:colanic acid exporter [compost metagenome]